MANSVEVEIKPISVWDCEYHGTYVDLVILEDGIPVYGKFTNDRGKVVTIPLTNIPLTNIPLDWPYDDRYGGGRLVGQQVYFRLNGQDWYDIPTHYDSETHNYHFDNGMVVHAGKLRVPPVPVGDPVLHHSGEVLVRAYFMDSATLLWANLSSGKTVLAKHLQPIGFKAGDIVWFRNKIGVVVRVIPAHSSMSLRFDGIHKYKIMYKPNAKSGYGESYLVAVYAGPNQKPYLYHPKSKVVKL